MKTPSKTPSEILEGNFRTVPAGTQKNRRRKLLVFPKQLLEELPEELEGEFLVELLEKFPVELLERFLNLAFLCVFIHKAF